MAQFEIGAPVYRREDRVETKATVLAIDATGAEAFYLIAYVEGGEGWWPATALSSSPPVAVL